MNVLLINGSSNKKGCTNKALSIIEKELNDNGISTQIFNIGNKAVRGCIGCKHCIKNQTSKCVFDDDVANECIDLAINADAIIVGSPVYFAGANGALTSILDRMFYAASSKLAYKPAAAIASARRAGTSATLDRLNKYFLFANMPIVSSMYWNEIHGNTPEETLQDLEGVQIMQVLGKNMAWLLKNIEAGKKSGVLKPEQEQRKMTNFIR